MGTRRRNDVDATSLRYIDVVTTSCACWEFGPPWPPKILNLGPPNILNLPTPMILTFTAIQDGVDDRKLWTTRRFMSFSTVFQSYQDMGGTVPLTGMVQTCR